MHPAPALTRSARGSAPPQPRTQVKVDSIRVTQGASVLYLRVLDGRGSVIPVHIGEAESSSLQKEINKQWVCRAACLEHTVVCLQRVLLAPSARRRGAP